MSHLSRVGKIWCGAHGLPRIASCFRNSRLYSMAAVPLSEAPRREWKPIEKKNPQTARISRLETGMTVASIEDYSSTSRVALYINAGSRYERYNTLGASHIMKICAFLSNKENSALKIAREMEQLGASLKATNTREHFIISSDSLRGHIQPVVNIIASTVKDPYFYRWEVNDRKDQVLLDLATKDADARAGIMEAVHHTAYRGSLSNSIYCPSFRTGSLSSDMLHNFAQECFTGPGMTLVGLGVNHDELVQIASSSFEDLSAKASHGNQKSLYVGGEARWWSETPLVNAAVVTEGVSLEDKDILPAGLLTRILGDSPTVKYGNNTQTSRLSKAVSQATSSPYAVSSINTSYSDTGLLGSYVIADGADIDKVLKAIVTQYQSIANSGVSNDELTRAKNQLKACAAMSCENYATVMGDLAVQAAYTANYKSPVEILDEVDKVSVQDIANVAKRLFSAPLTLVASGNIEKVPALQSLRK